MPKAATGPLFIPLYIPTIALYRLLLTDNTTICCYSIKRRGNAGEQIWMMPVKMQTNIFVAKKTIDKAFGHDKGKHSVPNSIFYSQAVMLQPFHLGFHTSNVLG